MQGSGTRRDDADEAGYRQACAWGEALRASWPPAWFPLRPRTIRFDVRVPALTDGRHYSLVLYNGRSGLSGRPAGGGGSGSDGLTDGAFKGGWVRATDGSPGLEMFRRLYGGVAAARRRGRVYKVEP